MLMPAVRLLAAVTALSVAGGCKPAASRTASSPNSGFVFAIVSGPNVSWERRHLRLGFEREAAKQGVTVIEETCASASDLRQAVTKLAGAAVDCAAVVPTGLGTKPEDLDEIARGGIPFITVGGDVPQCARMAFVGSDERRNGQLVAQQLLFGLPESGDIAIISDASSDPRVQTRVEGCESYLRNRRKPVRRLWKLECKTADDASAKLVSLRRLHPSVRGVCAIGSSAVDGAASNAGTGLRVVGFGGSEANLDRLRESKLVALICPVPYAMGRQCIRVMSILAQGRGLDSVTFDNPPIVVKRANLDRFLRDRVQQ